MSSRFSWIGGSERPIGEEFESRAVRHRRTASRPNRTLKDLSMTDYPRDLVGYGPVRPIRTGRAARASRVQIVMNYEEGSELCDPATATAPRGVPGEVPVATAAPGKRDLARRVDLRVRQPRRVLAADATLRRARHQGDVSSRVRRRAGAQPGGRPRRSRGAATRSAATAGAGSSSRRRPRRGARAHPRARSIRSRALTGERPLGWYCRYGPA